MSRIIIQSNGGQQLEVEQATFDAGYFPGYWYVRDAGGGVTPVVPAYIDAEFAAAVGSPTTQTAAALRAAFAARIGRLSNLGNMVPAGGRASIPQDFIGSLTSQYNIYRVELTARAAAVRLLYVNWAGPAGTSERPGTADLVVTAKVGLTDGTFRNVPFGGQTSGRVGPGGFIVSDPVAVDTSDPIWAHTLVAAYQPGTSTPVAGAIPRGPTPTAAGESTTSNAPSTTDLTSTGNGDYQFMYCPFVLNSPPRGLAPYTLASFGDSIQVGQDDGPQSFYGWQPRFSLPQHIPVIKLGQGGSTAAQFVTGLGHALSLPLVEGASHATVGYGTNDLGTDAVNTAGQQTIMANLVTAWTLVGGYVGKVAALTITPRTTSTDSWATLANQTPVASNPARIAINTWLRAGAPIDHTSSAPVAVGTAGALVAGQVGHPLDRVIDMADAVESARNSGLFRVDGGAWTYDGIHFSALGYTAMAAAVPVGWFS